MKLLAILMCTIALLATSCGRQPRSCAVCKREECAGLAFQLTLEDGGSVQTCCPRCAVHYLHTTGKSARAMQATDYPSGKWIDASKAVYVSGSDVTHCSPIEAKRDGYGCCYFKVYDRCMPSLIAFADQKEARTFQQEHSGEIIAFDQISPE